jgi:hypothetical protein
MNIWISRVVIRIRVWFEPGCMMSIFGGPTKTAKRLIGTVASLALAIVGVEPSRAGSFPQRGATRPDGVVSVLRVQIPFGGGEQTDARPTLALVVGPSWSFESETPTFASYRYAPSLEAGVTFGSAPLLRFGSIDMLRAGQSRWAHAGAPDGSQNTVWMWILGGVAVVAVLSAVASNNNGSNIPSCDPRYYTYDPERAACVLDPNKPGAFTPPPAPKPY